MTPRQQRRLAQAREQAATLGMSLEQWRAWRASEHTARLEREESFRTYRQQLDRKERKGRLATGRGTVVDLLAERTELTLAGMRTSFERHLLTGKTS